MNGDFPGVSTILSSLLNSTGRNAPFYFFREKYNPFYETIKFFEKEVYYVYYFNIKNLFIIFSGTFDIPSSMVNDACQMV